MEKLKQPCGLHCIKIKNISVSLGGQSIIEDVNIHIHCGRLTAIIGKNGAGKSTLVKAMLGEVPHEGSVEFKNHENGDFQKLRIGYVPQHLNLEKNTPSTVYDLIASFDSKVPVFLHRSKKEANRIKEHLKVFEAEELLNQQVCNLSGGELQRVLLTLAIMSEPNLLILDEPVSGIDKNGMDLFYGTIDRLKREYDLAIILISHDLEYVEQYADEVILLEKNVLKQGTVEDVFKSQEFFQVFGKPHIFYRNDLPEGGGE